jgi:hypothetical protein
MLKISTPHDIQLDNDVIAGAVIGAARVLFLFNTTTLICALRHGVMVIMMEKFVRACPQYYYIRWIVVLFLLVVLTRQLAAALTVHYSAWHLLDSKSYKQVYRGCAKAAFNGASKLVVTPFGRWKLSIVLISC